MSAKLNFYCAWFCPFAQRAWIALLEKGVAFEYIEYNPYKEKSDEFLRLNPRGLVPVLEVNGQSVYESDVCIEFIDEYGGPTNRLLPLDPLARAKTRIVCGYISREIIPAFYGLLLKQDANTQEKIKSALLQNLKMLMTYKQNSSPFFGGDKMGMADIMLIPFAARFPVLSHYRGFEIPEEEGYKDFQEWLKACKEQQSVIKTSCDIDKAIMVYQSYADGSANVRSKI
uniref:Glutathione S-transferase omega n=1 Tax=Crassostrea virginica TaxID=6565 RepID=A0A8B8EFH6_CRAVI|nr:glutathione S-transferase U21-like [Crassostrea virginica]